MPTKMTKREFLSRSSRALAGLGLLGLGAGCSGARRARASSPAPIPALRDLMAARVAQGELPGAVWLVARGDDVSADAVGVTHVGGSAPMRRDTIFRIASMTKAVTATAVMMLVEEGKLALDAPAQRWLPELSDRRVLRRIDGPLDDTVLSVPRMPTRPSSRKFRGAWVGAGGWRLVPLRWGSLLPS